MSGPFVRRTNRMAKNANQYFRSRDQIEPTAGGWCFDHSYTQLPSILYEAVKPQPVREARSVMLNESLAQTLGLDVDYLQEPQGIAELVGNRVPNGANPIAQAYAGHQFGGFTMLGDGRAIVLGEQLTPAGERYDVQYKGSGQTPYSRRGDGRAALGPMLREYVISEAMHALGIATTRSLAVVATGEPVFRPEPLPGAVLVRIAASHLRVGTFQYAAARGNRSTIQALADYTIARHYPDCEADDRPYVALLEAVARKQAALIAQWVGVGFIHGVMNTDNMAISGETIDYGPCAFMDQYDLNTVFSSIDSMGRYAYGQQPRIGHWNLARFAETLLPLLHDEQERAIAVAEESLEVYVRHYQERWQDIMCAKLGFQQSSSDAVSLVQDWLKALQESKADFTLSFAALSDSDEAVEEILGQHPELRELIDRWRAQVVGQDTPMEHVRQRMRAINPVVIPRNHLVEEALSAAQDEQIVEPFQQLLDAVTQPYNYDDAPERYRVPGPLNPTYQTFCGT